MNASRPVEGVAGLFGRGAGQGGMGMVFWLPTDERHRRALRRRGCRSRGPGPGRCRPAPASATCSASSTTSKSSSSRIWRASSMGRSTTLGTSTCSGTSRRTRSKMPERVGEEPQEPGRAWPAGAGARRGTTTSAFAPWLLVVVVVARRDVELAGTAGVASCRRHRGGGAATRRPRRAPRPGHGVDPESLAVPAQVGAEVLGVGVAVLGSLLEELHVIASSSGAIDALTWRGGVGASCTCL